MPPTVAHPGPPALRGQQQLHLQLRGFNGDPRGAEDKVKGDLDREWNTMRVWEGLVGGAGQGLDRGKGGRGNLGASLHGVPQLTLDVGGILIRQAQRLLLEWREKERSAGVTKAPKTPLLRESTLG